MWRSLRKTQDADTTESRVDTLQRLEKVLQEGASEPASDQGGWEDLEPNPWNTSTQSSDPGNGDPPIEESETLLTFVSEQSVDASSKEEQTADQAVSSGNTDRPDQDDQPVAIAAFRNAVSEACEEAETQLASVVEKIREAEAEEHAAELAQIVDRHAAELRQTREAVEVEVARRVREEESQRYTTELSRVREELERRYADDLQKAQTAVVDSLKGLTRNISGTL